MKKTMGRRMDAVERAMKFLLEKRMSEEYLDDTEPKVSVEMRHWYTVPVGAGGNMVSAKLPGWAERVEKMEAMCPMRSTMRHALLKEKV